LVTVPRQCGRAFVAIGIVEIFWIVTEWPNGAFAITFAAIVVLLLAPLAERAYAAAVRFMIGNVLATVFTAANARGAGQRPCRSGERPCRRIKGRQGARGKAQPCRTARHEPAHCMVDEDQVPEP
jgi:Fusaric acid resistance protein family